MLDKLRTAALGKAAPMVARLPILWGVEFAAKGQLREFGPAEVGYGADEFWPGALKSVTWKGKTYGVPTNNETMAMIWNAGIFQDAGLDPESPPATWDDVVAYSQADQGEDRQERLRHGRPRQCRQHAVPLHAAGLGLRRRRARRGRGQPDLQDHLHQQRRARRRALQASYDMYVRDKSVPTSALTNTQNENQDPFIAGNLAMMIAHPAEYAVMLDRARKATGDDRKTADAVVANMRYGLIPKGAARRAVVFGGSNVHVFRPDLVDGGLDLERGQGHHRLRHRAGMVDQDGLGQLQPGQSARLPDQVDEGAARDDPVPERDDLHAAARHPLPGGAAVD